MTWRLWPRKRRGMHSKGSRPMPDGARAVPRDARLHVELEAARERLEAVEARAPAVDYRERRATGWLARNHLGPLFDQAFGAGK